MRGSIAPGVSRTLAKAGLRPLGSGSSRMREGIRVSRASGPPSGAYVHVDFDSAGAAARRADELAPILEAAGYSTRRVNDTMLHVTKEAALPKWKRGDLSDRLQNHMSAESIYERQIGDTLQVVERLMLRDRPTQDCRPLYRLVEVKNGKARAIRTAELRVADTQREVRAAADRRARRLLKAAA